MLTLTDKHSVSGSESPAKIKQKRNNEITPKYYTLRHYLGNCNTIITQKNAH